MRFLLAFSLLTFHAPTEQGEFIQKKKVPTNRIDSVLAEHTDSLMSIPGVVGVGIGELKGKPCIKVMVDSQARRRGGKRIPKSLGGFPVVIEETGEIKARGKTLPH